MSELRIGEQNDLGQIRGVDGSEIEANIMTQRDEQLRERTDEGRFALDDGGEPGWRFSSIVIVRRR